MSGEFLTFATIGSWFEPDTLTILGTDYKLLLDARVTLPVIIEGIIINIISRNAILRCIDPAQLLPKLQLETDDDYLLEDGGFILLDGV